MTLIYQSGKWVVQPAKTTVESRGFKYLDGTNIVAADAKIAPLVATEHAATIAYAKQPLGVSTDFEMSSYFSLVGDVSAMAWRDEQHVVANRAVYRDKFAKVLTILADVLDVQAPDASFYLWPHTPIDAVEFAAGLFTDEHVTVLPGTFLSRACLRHDAALGTADDPGAQRVRMALVAGVDECVEAAHRVRRYVERLR